MEADALWPAPAPVPRSVLEPSLDALLAAGLIELLPNDHYHVHGVDAERQARSEHGRKAAERRWHAPSIASGSATSNAHPLHATPSLAKPRLAPREAAPGEGGNASNDGHPMAPEGSDSLLPFDPKAYDEQVAVRHAKRFGS